MNRVFTTLVLCASLVGVPAAHAANRDDQDPVFSEGLPQDMNQQGKEAGKQVAIGAVEAVGAVELIEELRNGRQSVFDAKIRFLQDELEDLMKDTTKRIPDMTEAQRTKRLTQIHTIQVKIANLRSKSVMSLLSSIQRPTAVKGVMVVGTALLITDIAGRIYVWNALERNPTLSPIGTYILHNSSKLLGETEAK